MLLLAPGQILAPYASDDSSNEEFSVFFDGRDIKSEKNAVLVFDGRVNGKGFVNIGKGDSLSYKGLGQESFVDYDLEESLFDVQTGDAVVKNKKHIIRVKDGKSFLDVKNIASGNLNMIRISQSRDFRKNPSSF